MCQSNVSSLKSVPIPFPSADREISRECFLAWYCYRITEQSQSSLITTFGFRAWLMLSVCHFLVPLAHSVLTAPCTGASRNLLCLEVQLRNGTMWLWSFALCTLQLLSLSAVSHCDSCLWHLMNKLLKINNA